MDAVNNSVACLSAGDDSAREFAADLNPKRKRKRGGEPASRRKNAQKRRATQKYGSDTETTHPVATTLKSPPKKPEPTYFGRAVAWLQNKRHANSKKPAKPIQSIFDLPPEVRDTVYLHYFQDTIQKVAFARTCYAKVDIYGDSTVVVEYKYEHYDNLLRCNNSLTSEAGKILVENILFEFRFQSQLEWFLKWLKRYSIPASSVRKLKLPELYCWTISDVGYRLFQTVGATWNKLGMNTLINVRELDIKVPLFYLPRKVYDKVCNSLTRVLDETERILFLWFSMPIMDTVLNFVRGMKNLKLLRLVRVLAPEVVAPFEHVYVPERVLSWWCRALLGLHVRVEVVDRETPKRYWLCEE
ncbi:hypothetical protein EJ08DRAFT_733566 [Tothia fuscella]|uniref:Uncharacterized protein n=1 Tax=Tothia fuscella TaxID=1048955 RepID=A0A9P4TZM1_9PEZI|nr:hypothetical protein EJ08DRAFT_733566 [Tothia fuscella]